MQEGKRKKVVCPIETKDGKTYWRTLGNAFVNKDNSINVYLDSFPVNGKLNIRDWDEVPKYGEGSTAARATAEAPAQYSLHSVGGGAQAGMKDELPF